LLVIYKIRFVKNPILLILLVLSFRFLSAQTFSRQSDGFPVSPGNENELNQPELKVFPNPVLQKQFTIELSNGYISEIRIANIAGKQVFTRKIATPETRILVEIDDLPDGIYFLRVNTFHNASKTIKLLIHSSR
jgi:hypothetical protein